jgi:hypothetical protein
MPVAHTCNPSNSGGRDQEDHGLKSAQANSLWDPILKKTYHKKRAGGVAQGGSSEFKPNCSKKTNQPPKQQNDSNYYICLN